MCQPHDLCPLEGNAPQGSAPCLSILSLLISWPTYLEALFSLCAEHPLTHSDCLWLPTSSPYALGILTSLGTEANILIRKEIDPFEDHQGRLCPTKSSPAAKATLCCFRPSRDRKTQKLRGQPLTIIFLLPNTSLCVLLSSKSIGTCRMFLAFSLSMTISFFWFTWWCIHSLPPQPEIGKQSLGIYIWLPQVHSPVLQGSKLQGEIICICCVGLLLVFFF